MTRVLITTAVCGSIGAVAFLSYSVLVSQSAVATNQAILMDMVRENRRVIDTNTLRIDAHARQLDALRNDLKSKKEK